tara:strand:- start:1570 stop:2442 length:873 start_codon:yes stop_codon:yes gene_type:complete
MSYNPFLRQQRMSQSLTQGYGSRIDIPPGTDVTVEGDFIDKDSDGIDDRYQTGPGEMDMREQFRNPPSGFTQRPGPATNALVHFYNETTGQSWTAPDGSWLPPQGWNVVPERIFTTPVGDEPVDTGLKTPVTTPVNPFPDGRMVDFEAYVNSYPDLIRAYKKKYGDDMSMLERWGRQHWRKQGKQAGRDMSFQAAPKFDPSLFKGKKTPELENKFGENTGGTAMRNQAKSWRQNQMDAAKKKYGFGTDDFNKSDFIKQRNQIASRHRRMVGAGDKKLKSGEVIKGYNPTS